jgi:hypothetical protein
VSMAKWLSDLNNFGRAFWYAAGTFWIVVGSCAFLREGSTLLGGVFALVTISSGLTILVRTRRDRSTDRRSLRETTP